MTKKVYDYKEMYRESTQLLDNAREMVGRYSLELERLKHRNDLQARAIEIMEEEAENSKSLIVMLEKKYETLSSIATSFVLLSILTDNDFKEVKK